MTATTVPLTLGMQIEIDDKYVLATVSQQIREENGVLGVDDSTPEAQAVKVFGDLLQPLFQTNATGIVVRELKGYSGPVWGDAVATLGKIRDLVKGLDSGGADAGEYGEGQAALARQVLELLEE